MRKRTFSFALAVCTICLLTMTSCSSVENSAVNGGGEAAESISAQTIGFTDVPGDAWYADGVAYCQKHGIMEGTGDAAFSPEAEVTRAILASVLYGMSDSPAVSAAADFDDTEAGAWYSDAVAWAVETGVIAGYGDGAFGVRDPVTREQAATILWRYGGKLESGPGRDFSDAVSIAPWAHAAVRWADAAGVTNGMTADGRFAPKASVKRGELAAMLYHYLSGSQPEQSGRTLVAYFSATGTTKLLAEYAADMLNADLYEIVPESPYTADDLNYNNKSSRASQEQATPSARPAISGSGANLGDYDVVLLGYPIWHGQAPKIIRTFLESYDFSGKVIVPFCTSHSSAIGSSDESLHAMAPGAQWRSGRRFAEGTSREAMEEWIGGLDLQTDTVPAFDFETKTVTLSSGYKMPINGLGTYSLTGETCVASVTAALERGVRLIDTAHIYGNEAEVGQAVRESGIPRDEIFVITKLYPNQFANAEAAIDEALERLDIGYIDLMLLHHPGTGDVAAYQAMEQAVAAGKVRSIGLSNWYVEDLEEFLPQVTIPPALVQNEIHPYYQENDVVPDIQSLGIVVQGWYPLGGRGHTAELLGDAVISEIAAVHGKSSAQVILRWNLQKGVVVIPGSSNPDHIQENTELYDFELTDEEMARINALDRGEKHDWY